MSRQIYKDVRYDLKKQKMETGLQEHLNENISPKEENSSLTINETQELPPWKIIISDDQEEVHKITKMVLEDYLFEGRGLNFISAYSGEETKAMILNNPDTAVLLLDVVMETDDAGLEVVHYIRKELKNDIVQIVLRTGQPGQAPEQQVILEYGINDYKSKVELTSQKLFTTITALLRAYKLSHSIKKLNIQLQEELLERKRAEQALRESEKMFRNIFENAFDLIQSIDADGKLVFVNSAWLKTLGYSQEEVQDLNFFDIISTDQAKRFKEIIYVVLKGVPVSGVETEFLKKDGGTVLVEGNLTPLQEDNNIIAHGIYRNITERKQAEEEARMHQEQLFQTAKMASLGTLVAGVAHEINNPVTSVLLNTPILEKVWSSVLPILDKYASTYGGFSVGNMSYEKLRERVPLLLSDITEGARRVKGIVSDLKDFARQSPSEMNEDINISTIAEKAVSFVKNMIKSADHFSLDYEENLPMIKGNSQRLEQVVINLLLNACQAFPGGSDLKITVSTGFGEGQGSIYIQIQDWGSGMPPEVLNRIKDPFFTTKRDIGGTGLGLAVSEKIVQDHGGVMDYVTESGEGTIARVSFPVDTT